MLDNISEEHRIFGFTRFLGISLVLFPSILGLDVIGLSSWKLELASSFWATGGDWTICEIFFISKESQGLACLLMNFRRLYSMSSKNLYKILGVSENSSSPDIKKAYFEVFFILLVLPFYSE